jgi:prepilin-type N-terminal cleavage/methylation domain-containing protein
MHELMRRLRDRGRPDDGFTLVELVICVAIVGIIMVALVGIVIEYLKTSDATSSRLTESGDVQFAGAYWQRDVSSIGVRSATYNSDPSVHSYPLLQSVSANGDTGVTPGCSMPPGSTIQVVLAWSVYTTSSAIDAPTRVTVAYVTQSSGTRLKLVRVGCTGSTQDSVTLLAHNIASGSVQVACPGGCNGSGSSVPNIVTLAFTSSDPNNPTAAPYSATLTGDRRQTS